MPIKPENRHKYPPDWKERRARILERADGMCQRCHLRIDSWQRKLARRGLRVAAVPAEPMVKSHVGGQS